MDDLTLRQEQLEKLAREKGERRVRKQVQKAQEKNRGADTPGGIALTKRYIEPLQKAIDAFKESAQTGKAGRRHSAVKLLADFPSDVAAYLTIKEALSGALRGIKLKSLAVSIGTAIESEVRLASFEDEKPNLYRYLDTQLKERGANPEHVRATYIFTANKFAMDLPTFTRTEKIHLGMKLIELLIETTGIIETELLQTGRRKAYHVIRPVEHVATWLEDRNVKAELLRPYYMPTVVPPRPWTGLWGGGYYTSEIRPRPLVKRPMKEHLELLKGANLDRVLTALNAIQNTGWKINTRVLEVMQKVWYEGLPIAMPQREDKKLPPKPADIDTNLAAKKEWKLSAKRTRESNVATRGKRLAIETAISIAEGLKDEAAIYFPHQLDFRGRAYAVPVGLNPQGSDYAKALLTFSYGKPITTPIAAGWLEIMGANLFGYDKVDLEGRIAWTQENDERIKRIARDPFSDLWWTEADGGKKAWSFLAWCFEYAAFLEEGYGYVSSLPISVDGSCNGLQHFSAMLRDPVGGAAVNLIPSKKPEDIYQRVADQTICLLSKESDPEKKWIAESWEVFGIDRKTTKRPVMVLPYGGTFRSCLGYVRAAVDEKLEKTGSRSPFGAEHPAATTYLAQQVWSGIGEVVVSARKTMAWLQTASREATRHKVPLKWTTPSGFIAFQKYLNFKIRRVETRLQGSIVKFVEAGEANGIDAGKQALSISPNFVHSMDASAMMLTIIDATEQGVEQFAMIHDSYGTVAADMDILSSALREAFVRMYSEHDVLSEFLNEIPEKAREKIDPPPPMGSLDLEQIGLVTSSSLKHLPFVELQHFKGITLLKSKGKQYMRKKSSVVIRMGAANWDATVNGVRFNFRDMTTPQRKQWYGAFMASVRKVLRGSR